MKKIVILILFVFFTKSFAQLAESYFHELPIVPKSVCDMSEESKKRLMNGVSEKLDKLEEEIAKKKKFQKEEMAKSQKEIENKMAKEYGISQAEAQKMKNGKMSKKEKNAIADKMLQEKAGMSMAEIQKLKGMSKEGKKQWAEAYASQQQANYAGGSDDEPNPEKEQMDKTLKKNMNLVNLTKERQKLIDIIHNDDVRFTRMFLELERKDSLERIELAEMVKPLKDKMNTGVSDEESVKLCKEIHNYEEIYCGKMSSPYLKTLREMHTSFMANLPNLRRIDELDSQINEAMYGKTLQDPMANGLMELEAVHTFANKYLNFFKYANFTSCIEDLENYRVRENK